MKFLKIVFFLIGIFIAVNARAQSSDELKRRRDKYNEELQKAGITSTDPNTVLGSPSLWQPCEAVAARALEHFKEADRIMARNPRRVVKAPKIMEEVYRVMLNGMTSRGWSPPRTRVSVSPLRLSWIAVQYAII